MPPNYKVASLLRQVRLFSTTNQLQNAVRVRFAPSPTGSIHLGGLRTALYNYMFAKKFGGKFILRIEDTDQSRVVSGSIGDIERSLDWAGLVRHEGPSEGGPYGPYLQSSRVDLYRSKAMDLLEAGKAYRCFCSPTRLELLRKQQARNREPPHYDRKCRHMSGIEIDEKMKENEGRFVVRFSLDPGSIEFQDMIFGTIRNTFDATVESDPVILKSDGFPTYHLANVVDDHSMEISHVLRGSEWLSSTAKHLSIYKAFKWDAPKFAHFPLITMKDGTKMSKRNEQSKVQFWIDRGYRPLAVINFLTNMGGGLPKSKQDSHELWTLDELANEFDFNQVTCHPATVDMNRLTIFNAKDLQLSWSQNPRIVIEDFKTMLQRNSMETDLTDERLVEIVGSFISRIETLNDLLSTEYAYIWHPPKLTWNKALYVEKGWDLERVITDIIEIVSSSENLEKETLERRLKSIAQGYGVEWPVLFRLVRKLLTNNDRGLPVHELVNYLGRQRSLEYLNCGLLYVMSS